MTNTKDLETKIAHLCALAREKFGVRSDQLDVVMRKLGRRVPKRIHKHAEVLLSAQASLGHPTLAMMVDEKKITQSYKAIAEHLKSIDPKLRRKNKMLDILASMAFSVLVVFALMILVLVWRGLL